MAKNIRAIIGGAGTGKTSRLMQEIDDAAREFGGLDSIGFSSMTRAARSEAVSRAAKAFGVPSSDLDRDGWFKTLHGVCYAALGASTANILAGDSKSQKWIEEEAFGGIPLGIDNIGAQHFFSRRVTPMVALRVWNYARTCVIPLRIACQRHRVPITTVAPLVARYETAKRLHSMMDFPDLQMQFVGAKYPTPEDDPVRVAPQGELPEVAVWLFDESQDMSRLCDLVARRLASAPSVQKAVLCGDIYQSIYGFSGSSARWMLGWEAEREVMPMSHRCPSRILAVGEQILRRQSVGQYWDRKIKPVRDGGELETTTSIRSLISRVNPADEWLLLARSNYQTKAIADAATRAGIPWEWTDDSGNPYGLEIRNGFRAAVALERGIPITAHDVRALFAAFPSGAGEGRLWDYGAKSEFDLKAWPADKRFTTEALSEAGATPRLRAALQTPEWTTLAKAGAVQLREMSARHGDDLVTTPRVRIGTIHSVKGAEADNVGVVYAPSAMSARVQARSKEAADEERRVEYVAVTRSRNRLVACYPPRTGRGPGRLW
jgi:superfamily I DNA/RNA helicase